MRGAGQWIGAPHQDGADRGDRRAQSLRGVLHEQHADRDSADTTYPTRRYPLRPRTQDGQFGLDLPDDFRGLDMPNSLVDDEIVASVGTMASSGICAPRGQWRWTDKAAAADLDRPANQRAAVITAG